MSFQNNSLHPIRPKPPLSFAQLLFSVGLFNISILSFADQLPYEEKHLLVSENVIHRWGYQTTQATQNSQDIIALTPKKIANEKSLRATLSLGRDCFNSAEELERYFAFQQSEAKQEPLAKDRELADQFVVGLCMYYVYTDEDRLFEQEQNQVRDLFKKYISTEHGIENKK
ncbi:hypothetical protein TDB9533_03435 [Thalassocella blandensis]|nr:hypothetical protein TDB9533_03435 [Thalassocella blandensis]